MKGLKTSTCISCHSLATIFSSTVLNSMLVVQWQLHLDLLCSSYVPVFLVVNPKIFTYFIVLCMDGSKGTTFL